MYDTKRVTMFTIRSFKGSQYRNLQVNVNKERMKKKTKSKIQYTLIKRTYTHKKEIEYRQEIKAIFFSYAKQDL